MACNGIALLLHFLNLDLAVFGRLTCVIERAVTVQVEWSLTAGGPYTKTAKGYARSYIQVHNFYHYMLLLPRSKIASATELHVKAVGKLPLAGRWQDRMHVLSKIQ